MITELDLERARTAVEDAARAVAKAEERGPDAWATARARHGHAAARLDRLTGDLAAQQATEERRAKTEASPTTRKLLDRMGGELAASAKLASEKFAAAQASLVDAVDAAVAHDQAVKRHAASLAELGLTIRDGDRYDNGAHRDGVRIGAVDWLRPRVHGLLPFLAGRVAAARLNDPRYLPQPHHSLAVLLAAVPSPPAADLPRPRYESAKPEGAPVFLAHGEKKPAGSTRHFEYDEWRAMEREARRAAIERGNELAVRQAGR